MKELNAYYSYYLGERNISVLPLNVYDPPERFIAYNKKKQRKSEHHTFRF
ncbi:hypothetical protein ECG581_2382 [Escherichia coli G58-1]|nr:hypothetical protein ECG581_2382 [Escherichia coli G58-1]